MSARNLLSLLRVQVAEGDSVEGVVSSEEEPVAQIPDKQGMSGAVPTLSHLPLAGQAAMCGCHGLTRPPRHLQDGLSCEERQRTGADRHVPETGLKCW